jgi:hypothetical protein
VHQVADRKRHSDALLGESAAVGGDDLGARLHAAAGQRDVGGDHDVAPPDAFGNPIVGGVHARAGGDPLDQRVLRNADEADGHDRDGKPMARGDAVDLVLHRTGIRIDVYAHRSLRRRQHALAGSRV